MLAAKGVPLGMEKPPFRSVSCARMRPMEQTGGKRRMLSLMQYLRYSRDFRSSL